MIMSNIGLRIRQLRESKGLTTNRLANICGISQSFLRAVELGEKGISVENLQLICDALKISMSAFFDDTDGAQSLDDELISVVFGLQPRQKRALLNFLKTLG